MDALWTDMGFIRWPISFALLAVVLISTYSGVRLFGWKAEADPITKAWIDAVFFWGGFAMISGVLGTLVGIIIAAQSIEAADAVSSPLVWGGVKVALLSSATGTLILALSALLWFGLQFRWRVLAADAASED